MHYKLIKRITFGKREKAKTYASFNHRGKIKGRDFTEELSRYTKLTPGDIIRLLYGLKDLLIQELERSNIVELEEIGTFQLSVRAKPADEDGSFTKKHIQKVTVTFTPNKKLRVEKNKIDFKQVQPANKCLPK